MHLSNPSISRHLHLFYFFPSSSNAERDTDSHRLFQHQAQHHTVIQSLELLMKKKMKFLPGSGSMPLPQNFESQKTKICAIWGILDENLKKSSTLKFIMNISFVLSICIHRSIILIFIEKNMLVIVLPTEQVFFPDFQFSFPRESSFPWQIWTYLYICTSLVWPIRWQRSCACASMVGFQSLS